jgi:hypothetical protein
MATEATADRIRGYLRSVYVDPARSRHESSVRIVAGDVHKALHLNNRVPAVCQVLGGRKFLMENNLVLEKQEGPRSGQSTTAAFVYRLAGTGSESQADRIEAAWKSLRGIAKDVYAALGGAENFLRNERDHFYNPGQDPLYRDGK